MFESLFTVIAPVFICAVIGWVWKRQGRPYDTTFVSTIVTNISTPCLAFATLVKTEIDPEVFFRMAAACVVTLIAFVVIYWPILKATKLSQRAFLPALTFANIGNMGLPLCLFAFGQEGLALAIAYFTANAIFLFSGGVAMAAGTMSLKALARIPMLYGVAAALVVMFTDLEAPIWVLNTTELIGGIMIPLMLITLGVSLAELKVSSLPRASFVSVLRLSFGFFVGVLTAEAFGMEGVERGVLIVQCTMPVAVFNYLFALRYDNEPAEVAGTVVISTLLSFLTLPALMAYVM